MRKCLLYACVPSFIPMSAAVRSEECRKLFDVVQTIYGCHGNKVVMEMMQHACIPSFISMRGTVCEFEE